jgi:hypothetical protein
VLAWKLFVERALQLYVSERTSAATFPLTGPLPPAADVPIESAGRRSFPRSDRNPQAGLRYIAQNHTTAEVGLPRTSTSFIEAA